MRWYKPVDDSSVPSFFSTPITQWNKTISLCEIFLGIFGALKGDGIAFARSCVTVALGVYVILFYCTNKRVTFQWINLNDSRSINVNVHFSENFSTVKVQGLISINLGYERLESLFVRCSIVVLKLQRHGIRHLRYMKFNRPQPRTTWNSSFTFIIIIFELKRPKIQLP